MLLDRDFENKKMRQLCQYNSSRAKLQTSAWSLSVKRDIIKSLNRIEAVLPYLRFNKEKSIQHYYDCIN